MQKIKIGDRVYINGREFIYSCADTTAGEYAPTDFLIDVKSGRVFELPFFRDSTKKDKEYPITVTMDASESVEYVKNNPSKLSDITYF